MDSIFGLFLLAVLGVFVSLAFRRLSALRQETREASVNSAENARRIAALTRRIYELEQQIQHSGAGTQTAAAQHEGPQGTLVPVETASREMPLLSIPVHLEEPSSIQPADPKPEPQEDWETIVGTNWLNRAGALVLVIGIALFLGYSLTHMGPAGKVVIGFGTALSLLALGLVVERHETYRSFSLGLIAGGWAMTYFTGYAMHGIEAARLIHDPFAGLAVLLAISGAMVWHSLKYQSEIATGLAFLFAFASLNVTALTSFSVVATAILAASLLALSVRFGWTRLSVAGVVLTYQTFVFRYDPSVYGRTGLLNGQATLWIYWLLFEVFDLAALARLGRRKGIQSSLFFLNAAGFLGSAMLHGWSMNSSEWYRFFGAASLAYLFSSLLRARIAGRTEDGPASRRVLEGGYEAAAAASAGLMAAALISRFSGLQMPLALLVEGEMIVLAGITLASRFLRSLGGLVLGAAFVRLVTVDIWADTKIPVVGRQLYAFTPTALLMTAVFAGNRLRNGGLLYGLGTTILLAVVISAELNEYWGTIAWSVLALVVLALGARLGKFDLRVQGYIGALVCFARAGIVLEWSRDERQGMLAAVATALVLYAAQWLIRTRVREPREGWTADYISVLGSALVSWILFDTVEGRLLTVALAFEAAALLIVGFLASERVLRLSGLVLFLLCIGKLFIYDMSELDTLSRILSFVVLGVMLIGASWVYTRYREKVRRLL